MFTKENLQKQLEKRTQNNYTKDDSKTQKHITSIVEHTPEIMILLQGIIARSYKLSNGNVDLMVAYIASSCFNAGITLGYFIGLDENNDKSKLVI